MNRTKWMFILGFLGGIFGTLLIISRKSEPQAKPSQPAKSPQPVNQRPPGSPQGDVSPRKQKPIRFAILHRIAALILIWTFVFLSLMWIAAFMINWLGLPQSGSIDLDKTQPVPSTSKGALVFLAALT